MKESLPLLPAIVQRAKDAARAVKQGVHEAVEQVKEKTLTQLLDLPQFEVNGYAVERNGEQDILHVFCKLSMDVGLCPRCKSMSTEIKQYKDRCVRDLDIWGKRTFLHFQIRRFDCPDCANVLIFNGD